MEKEPQPDSMTTVNMKPEYPPSEVYSSEPPPAYQKPQSSAVQVAKIVAVTVVLVSFILGSFLLASAYVSANASCRQLEQELELINEAADRFQGAPLQPEALVQDETQAQIQNKRQTDSDSSKKNNDIDNNSIDNSESSDSSSDSSSSSESDDDEDRAPIKFKLPLQLDFDDLAGALIERNQKSRMNCIVEKKRAEEVVDHQPKTLRLPFGLNLTTDPRYEHVSGERMAIFCESGNIQRNTPQNNENENDDDDDEEEEQTIMIQPVMIPIPQSNYPTHMAQQMMPPQPQRFSPIHPMEQMRPPMPIPQQPQQQSQQSQLPPNPILHQIAQQIIAQKIMEAQRAREEQQQQEQHQQPEPSEQRHIPQRFFPEAMVAQRLPPLPEEILTQLNRLPNRNVIVAVSEQDSDEDSQENNVAPQQHQQMRVVPQEIHVVPQEVRIVHQEMKVAGPQDPQPPIVQNQRQSAAEMNGRQTYARGLPVNIPVHMIQQEQQDPQAAASEETRPHYLQPRSLRSVRSVDALLPKNQKRMKRCSCDCAC